jgi:hypothetical protein
MRSLNDRCTILFFSAATRLRYDRHLRHPFLIFPEEPVRPRFEQATVRQVPNARASFLRGSICLMSDAISRSAYE